MRTAIPLLSVCAALLAAGSARAQSVSCDGAGDLPCGYQINSFQIEPAPNLLKFQARVSQAKLPVGDGVFGRVIVAVVRGSEKLCSEEFHDVRVSYSAINLDVGRNMDCDLGKVVAANQDLALQVCIGGADNCLRPVTLATAPYSLKSTYAVLAQQAYVADVAGEASYAQRGSADRDMLLRKELRTGYFDFSTPDSAPSLYASGSDFTPYANGGFLTWTPRLESAPTLHVAARDVARDTPMPLGRLLLESSSTETLGRLVVRSNGMQVTGASSINGATTVLGMLHVNARTDGGLSGLAVQGPGAFSDTLNIGGATTVARGGIHVVGDSDYTGSLSVAGTVAPGASLTVTPGGGNISGDIQLTGNMVGGGTLSAPSANLPGLTVGATGAIVNGPLTATGPVFLSSGVPLTGAASNFNVPGTLTAATLGVAGAATVANVTAAGNVGAAGKDPNSGYPAGWTGGLHTRDVYAEGSVGVGPSGGPPTASIDSGGTIRAQSAAISGNLSVGTINGHPPGVGDGGVGLTKVGCVRTGGISWWRYECTCPAGSGVISISTWPSDDAMYRTPEPTQDPSDRSRTPVLTQYLTHFGTSTSDPTTRGQVSCGRGQVPEVMPCGNNTVTALCLTGL